MILVMISNGISHSCTKYFIFNVEERTRKLSFASAVLRVATGRPVPSEELSSSQKELTLIS